MKFSDIAQEGWDELRPYFDTCLLPLTGLTGMEQPWEATQHLEELRDALDLLEIPLKGRTVTYPALHYIGEALTADTNLLGSVCANLKKAGFRFIVVVASKSEAELPVREGIADLVLRFTPEELSSGTDQSKQRAAEQMRLLWSGNHSL